MIDYANYYQPIRITPYWTELEQDLSGADLTYGKQLISSAIDYVSKMLSVLPVADGLYITPTCYLGGDHSVTNPITGITYSNCYNEAPVACGPHINIPINHHGYYFDYDASDQYAQADRDFYTGGGAMADTDLVIYVTSKTDQNCNVNSSTIAWAGACNVDQFGRPIAGTINICPRLFDAPLWEKDVIVAIHELTHVLGMSSALFPEFINGYTEKLVEKNTKHSEINNKIFTVCQDILWRHYNTVPCDIPRECEKRFSCRFFRD